MALMVLHLFSSIHFIQLTLLKRDPMLPDFANERDFICQYQIAALFIFTQILFIFALTLFFISLIPPSCSNLFLIGHCFSLLIVHHCSLL